jgi:hypothetical protein
MLPVPLRQWVVLVPQEDPERRDLPLSDDFREEFLARYGSLVSYSDEESEGGEGLQFRGGGH